MELICGPLLNIETEGKGPWFGKRDCGNIITWTHENPFRIESEKKIINSIQGLIHFE